MPTHAARPAGNGRRLRLSLAAAAVLAVAAGTGLSVRQTFSSADETAPAPSGSVAAPVVGGATSVPRPSVPPSSAPPSAKPSKTAERPSGGTLAGKRLYTDPAGAAAEQVKTLRNNGQGGDASTISKIADQPTATWFADANPGYYDRARKLVSNARSAGRLPVLALYNIPHRDCSGQSAGGAASADAYKAYIATMVNALKGRQAVVVLEPDAVAQAVQGCLDEGRAAERYDLLAHAVDALSANSGVHVYLDAGNPTWITDTSRMAEALKRAGIENARGFALNVANFEATGTNVDYGTRLSGDLGGKPFVVDTSRNGNGPAAKGPRGDEHWCNPEGRKLGERPTTNTGTDLVDAYLWIKRPGESDGACGNGAPPAGQWFADYALALAR